MTKLHFTVLFTCILTFAGQSEGALVLVSDNGGTSNYGYGHSAWSGFTNALNTATGNNVTVTSNLSNLAFMLGFDALLVDQRWTSGVLSPSEVANITSYIATGRRVLMMGENSNFTNWNTQILAIVGGNFGGNTFNVAANAVLVDPLTAGASVINLPGAGFAIGGTALYSPNFATLWGASNVLTVLDVNVWADGGPANGAQFGTNVAHWLASTPGVSPAVPEPASLALFGIGAGVTCLAVARRRNQQNSEFNSRIGATR